MRALLAHRHYRLWMTKPRDTPQGQLAQRPNALIRAIVIVVLIVGVILHELSATVTDAANTTTSAHGIIGEGAHQAQSWLSHYFG